jgi:sulfur-oxidizing protein SoxY
MQQLNSNPINAKRRTFFWALMLASASALLLPFRAIAAVWNGAAFAAEKLDKAQKDLGISAEILSKEIEIIAPDRAENGAIVQVEVKSSIPNTEAFALFVEKNPTVLIANYMFTNGASPHIVTRIKMAETSEIKVIVKAGNRYFTASKKVEVLENGCGGGGSINENFDPSIKLRAKLVGNKTEVKAIIVHPMHTGRGKADSGELIAAHFIQTVNVVLNEKTVLDAQCGTGISRNPYLTFYLDGAKLGDTIRLHWHDNLGYEGVGSVQVSQ